MTFMAYGSFFMLGAAFTLQRLGHVRTDLLYERWTPRRQATIDLVCTCSSLCPSSTCLW